jgi:kumamolisin
MRLLHHPIRAGAVAVLGLAMTAGTGALSATMASAAPVSTPFTALANSVPVTTDHATGIYSSPNMSVEVALKPHNAAGLAKEMKALYTKHSGAYHHWLAKGQFNSRYAPTKAERAKVASYLRSAGLKVQESSSPFLVRATGSSTKMTSAFKTTLKTYKDSHGVRYFSNSAAVHVPTSLGSSVFGVIGLSNTIRERSMVQRVKSVKPVSRAKLKTVKNGTASCEGSYPTTQDIYDLVLNGQLDEPLGYGGGPGCSGLTPSQDNSIYGAPNAGKRGKGAGVNMAVFELSGYLHSDIDTWAQTFYGSSYNPPLVDVNVDGGPLSPVCPAGDTCPANFNGYSGDIEVDADIEMQLAMAPDASHLTVYNAPNDFTGQTELDEYTAIAAADKAAVVSSSWAVCENDESAAYVQAENTVFEQMAAQGQSMFGAEGDTGAFSCVRSDGTTILNVLDPPSQPWVTSVGGTSLESDNPGTTANPSYPAGVESVWNVDNLCNSSADEGGENGFFWCAETGAGGGGSSQWWGRPFYQFGKGVNNPNTTYANGSTQCALASSGTACREDPDVSANADEFTPYAEYCTGNPNPPDYSDCGTFSGGENPPGWFGIGGTSLASPLWSAVIADRDSFQGFRSGNINPLMYTLNALLPGFYLHDINGAQATNNNGAFPTTPGYDEATGLGTPKMTQLITLSL